EPGTYLPRLQKSILKHVNNAGTTQIGVDAASAPNLTDEQRQMLTMTVPANVLVGADGQKLSNAQVGISTVPPELVMDVLPAGALEHTFDITVQAPGVTNFSTPVPMSFPNVFDAAPGTQLNFLSFDHTTGRLVIEGTATVSADGKSVKTDPGVGITHPGWHGLTPPGSSTCQAPPNDHPQNHVPPDVEIGETGSFHDLQDHLFWKDFQDDAHRKPEGFTIHFRNNAPGAFSCAPSNNSPAQVFVKIEQPARKFMQLTALNSSFLNDT